MPLSAWGPALLLFLVAIPVAAVPMRRDVRGPVPGALAVLAWIAAVLLGGGSWLVALVGLAAGLPLLIRSDRPRTATLARFAGAIAAFVLLIAAHPASLETGAGLALLALTAIALLCFVGRGPETNKVPGVEATHLVAVALGLVVIAVDVGRLGPSIELPAILAGLALGFLLGSRPAFGRNLGTPVSDTLAILVAWLLADAALTVTWPPPLVLCSIAALEIAVLLWTAARADRSNDKDRPRGVFVEALGRKRTPRELSVATAIAGAVTIVLALGASQGEWIAALLGAGALMWLLQRYLWRLVPERRKR